MTDEEDRKLEEDRRVEEERRRAKKPLSETLMSELNMDQRETLGELKKFGWELRFVRHDPEQRPVPVIFDSERSKFAVLDQDGSLDEIAFDNLRQEPDETKTP